MMKKIFIGSTVQDLGQYRLQVQDALLRRAQVAAFLSEDWIGGYDNTVEKCRDQLMTSDGYFGIFAYWYGSIPPDYTESITHLEFRWAKQKWLKPGSKYPRIAVFMPGYRDSMGSREPCQAEKELKMVAKNLLRNVPSQYRKKHSDLLKSFHKEINCQGHEWRTKQYFKSINELRELAITTCLTWEKYLLQQEMPPPGEANSQLAERQVNSAELGLLGRRKHLDVVKNVIGQLMNPLIPGIAMLIHGNEDAGQREFLDQIVTLKALRYNRSPQRGRPPLVDHYYKFESLVRWMSERVGDPTAVHNRIEDLNSLAKAIHTNLQRQQLVLILDQIGLYENGIKGFQQTFWAPLYTELARLRNQNQNLKYHRLVLFVVDYSGRVGSWGDSAAEIGPDQDDFDYSRLVSLPQLSNIKDSDVRLWLAELEVPDRPLGRCEEIVQSVLTNPAGEPDGTPRRVFDRLRRESLWLEDN